MSDSGGLSLDARILAKHVFRCGTGASASIRIISEASEILNTASLSASHMRCLTDLSRAANQLRGTLEDAMDFASIFVSQDAPTAELMRPDQLIIDVEKELRSLAHDAGVSLSFTFEADLPTHINSDFKSLRRILLHLGRNAVAASRRGSVYIALGMEKGADASAQLSISVRDSGPGMPQKEIAFLQDKDQKDLLLFKEDGEVELGLSIVRHRVRELGGQIGVDLMESGGTRVWLEIPVAVVHPDIAETLAPARPSRVDGNAVTAKIISKSRHRVMIVDDSPVNQVLFKKVLQKMDVEITVAKNGQEALTSTGSGEFDLILMDCQMPVMDGLEATRRIRALESEGEKRTPIIALSAGDSEEEIERCFEAGMDDFVSKPISPKDLVKVVEKHTGKIVSMPEAADAKPE